MFRDVGNKLLVVKQGYLFPKFAQCDINDESRQGVREVDWSQDQGEAVSVYGDKRKTCLGQPISCKAVFQIWATQVCDHEAKDPANELTQTQMVNIFPEFKYKLDLWEKCCDKNGKIVKNFAYYKEYSLKPHKMGKRSMKKWY